MYHLKLTTESYKLFLPLIITEDFFKPTADRMQFFLPEFTFCYCRHTAKEYNWDLSLLFRAERGIFENVPKRR